MKGGIKLEDAKERYSINSFCIICRKGFQYPYGRWNIAGDLQSGTCSKACEMQQQNKVHCSAFKENEDASILSSKDEGTAS